MPPHFGPLARRATTLLLMGLAVVALLPALAHAAQPASLRLLGSDPEYRSVQLNTLTGQHVTASPGLFRLRITPAGGSAVVRRGFCADAHHAINGGTDYSVSLRTAADEPLLASERYSEAGWLVQQAEALIAAAAPSARTLEAGALQVAVWQLTDQLGETSPTNDAALNARAAVLRSLASGRAVGGPITITHADAKGCAGRSAVPLRLTGRPGSTATLAVTAGTGVVAPATVRFDAAGRADASLTSTTPQAVTVTASTDGGSLTRAARASPGASTPQETIFLVPSSYTASTTVTFDDCPVIPLDTTPTVPMTPGVGVGPLDTTVTPFETPSTPTESTPAPSAPRRTNQSSPTFTVTKTGPATAAAGSTVTYKIRVRNRGTVALGGLAVADDLPAGMSLARIPSGSSLRGGRLVWTLSSLGAGRSRTLSVSVRIDQDVTGRRCNRATVTRAGSTPARSTACTRITSTPRVIRPAVTA